uniref:phycytochrome bilisome core-membrane linker protein n=1 Tax=Bangia atropurpurea TaxID=31347 RepID=UPI001FCDA775|nr:phycytochrome bilisome core-membrane linker protein [Bangia atropurpurea]UNJ18284.1 phycytochrome bilisome core-membrane linker protein [Bangia atropurpurea]
MSIKASGGSPLARPQLYRTASILTITQAEQQDRFLQLGELNQLVSFLNSGQKRLEVADILTKNANILVARAADKIFVGGSAISYLERPQAAVIIAGDQSSKDKINELSGNIQGDFGQSFRSLFNAGGATPPGFKPINVLRYGTTRMRKSLRDLDWFLRYLTYAIVSGDPNILSVNIRGLRELIDNACSSAAAIVALREMRRTALAIFEEDIKGQDLVREYFNVVIAEFEAPSLTDKLRKRESGDLQGLRLPQTYAQAGVSTPRFVMKSSLSADEKNTVIKACYRQIFERDIAKAYDLSLSNLESQVKNGQISIKEFIRSLGISSIYRKQFYEPFVNSRALELAFRHFLGRGPSSLEEFQKYFAILSATGLSGLVNAILNSTEYTDYFGEETVPYLRNLGEEPQECRNWGPQIDLLNYSAPFRKVPQFITLFSDYKQSLPDQHPYGTGNDPLSIQFGAIFPKENKDPRKRQALFGKDTRRILVRRGPGIYNQISNPQVRPKSAGSLGPKIFKLSNALATTNLSSEFDNSVEVITKVAYLRVFGRDVYQEEKLILKPIESQLQDGQITVREFVRQLAKSSIFRSLYWEPLYICKAIEYIHNRLLGRPTYGRQEINKYFDIAYKQGYYQVIDAIIDSSEYIETFGDNVVPYERYTTPAGIALRSLRPGIINQKFKKVISSRSARFVELGEVKEIRSSNDIQSRIAQGVTALRDQSVIFEVNPDSSQEVLEQALRAAYRQIFERDLNSFSIGGEFLDIEASFLNKQINVKELVKQLALSELYGKEFYQPYPNTKVIELGTKHILGRAPNNQAEIRFLNQILASKGLSAFVDTLVNSAEYDSVYGTTTVPYRRFPTLPAANFPNTETLYNRLTKQDLSIVVPSFKKVLGNQ